MKRISVRAGSERHRHRDGDDAGIRHTWLGDDAAMEHTGPTPSTSLSLLPTPPSPLPMRTFPTRGDIVRVKPDYPSRPATASRYPPYYVNRSTLPATPGLSVHSRVRYQRCRGFRRYRQRHGLCRHRDLGAGQAQRQLHRAASRLPAFWLANTGVRSTCCVA